jgi:hypothetical protein
MIDARVGSNFIHAAVIFGHPPYVWTEVAPLERKLFIMVMSMNHHNNNNGIQQQHQQQQQRGGMQQQQQRGGKQQQQQQDAMATPIQIPPPSYVKIVLTGLVFLLSLTNLFQAGILRTTTASRTVAWGDYNNYFDYNSTLRTMEYHQQPKPNFAASFNHHNDTTANVTTADLHIAHQLRRRQVNGSSSSSLSSQDKDDEEEDFYSSSSLELQLQQMSFDDDHETNHNHHNNNKTLTVVVAHCRENLMFLEHFGSCRNGRVSFAIMSKCNATIPDFSNTIISECVTVYPIDNCGTEEYAYFKYVQDHYLTLPDTVAFIQGDGLTENPHLVYDIFHTIPGTYYMDLSRIITRWYTLQDVDPVRDTMIGQVAPQLLNESTWFINLRGQFLASREALQRIPQDVYQRFNDMLCGKNCTSRNCNAEFWFPPMFGCYHAMFRGPDCEEYEHYLTPRVIPQDFKKDSLIGSHHETQAWSTIQTTCRFGGHNSTNGAIQIVRTILVAEAEVNGRLICVEQQHNDNDHHRHHRNNTRNVVQRWWRHVLHELYSEPKWPNLDNLAWRFNRTLVKHMNRGSSWWQ